jgi:hypothetical protein
VGTVDDGCSDCALASTSMDDEGEGAMEVLSRVIKMYNV